MELRNQDKTRSIRLPSSFTSYHNHRQNHRSPPPHQQEKAEGKFPSFIPPSFPTTNTITGPENGRRSGERQTDVDEDTPLIHTSTFQTLDHNHHPHHGRQQQQDEEQRKPRRDPTADSDPAPPSIHNHEPQPDEHPPQPPSPLQNTDQIATPVPGDATTSAVMNNSRYRECQRNHAAHLGGYVLDGCGEFMPGGDEGTSKALFCAACDCHRNFHRQVINNDGLTPPPLPLPPATTNTRLQPSHIITPPVLPYHLHQNHHHRMTSTTMMTFGGGTAAESSSEDLHTFGVVHHHNEQQRQGMMEFGGGSSRKRFRTKFTQEQKDRMMEFAEKIGWKIQKQDDVEVKAFCEDVGVKRKVFKVWMHNNKRKP